MIHKFVHTCEIFFKLCEDPSFNKDNKKKLLYQLLGELNYLVLKLDEDDFENEIDDSKIEDLDRITDSHARPFISKSFQCLGFYHSVLNPNEILEKVQPGVGDAIDDILDIYKDLKEGHEHYLNHNYSEAAWVWRYNYKSHWGEHLVNLQAMLYHLVDWN